MCKALKNKSKDIPKDYSFQATQQTLDLMLERDKLEAKKLSRTLSVSIVFAVILVICLTMLLVLLPLLTAQIGSLFSHLPEYVVMLHSSITPWLTSLGFPI